MTGCTQAMSSSRTSPTSDSSDGGTATDDREWIARATWAARQRPRGPPGQRRPRERRLGAPRGAHLHARKGGRARAPDHAPVPVRGVFAEADSRGGTLARRTRRSRALAEDAPGDRRTGDAPHGARADPPDGRRGGAPSRATELPDAGLQLPRRGPDRAPAVR